MVHSNSYSQATTGTLAEFRMLELLKDCAFDFDSPISQYSELSDVKQQVLQRSELTRLAVGTDVG
jgi:hypothetical protein